MQNWDRHQKEYQDKVGICPQVVLVQEYYARIKALRWQAMGLRAEEVDEPEGGSLQRWHFPHKLQELGEGDLDVLSKECANVGLGHLFKAALKLP